MTKILLYLFITSFSFFSCNHHDETNEKKEIITSTVDTNKQVIATPNYSIQLFLADSLNSKLGFGYNILIDGNVFIHQPSIPSVPGNKSFSTKEKAESVANLMMLKLKNNIMPPSVSKKELDSLQVLN